ncbi:MAG: type II toxin-antitoxin system PemK/MazF family toxin [Alphaproteobacteria bacterium]|nr:type II toxin-antitoxin system PemK/MazF family toxin [Alphaproteobacteria bacterium]
MPIPAPFPGLVIGYSYLWSHERKKGMAEGVKDRPCAIVLVKSEDDGGHKIVTVAPITHSPNDPKRAVQLSPKLKRHLGLDDEASWIVLDEMNRFAWPGLDLRPISRRHPGVFSFGVLPIDVFEQIKAVFNELRAERVLTRVISREP